MRFVFAHALIIAVLLLAVSAAAVEKIYFGDIGDDKIRRCNLNGSSIEELVTTGLEAVGSIAIDRTAGKMYWADWLSSTAHIQRADLDGSNVETILGGLAGPYGVALDVAAGKIYWTEFSSAKIRRSNLDGTNIEDLITVGLTHPNGIALDLIHGKMYFTQTGTPGKIRRAGLDGTNIEDLVTAGLSSPQEIALDIAAGKMYWCDLGTDSVYRADMDGSNVEGLIGSEQESPIGIDLDLEAGKMYFSDSGGAGARIRSANLDGTNVLDVVSAGFGSCYGLALGPAEAECSDVSLAGTWLIRVVGVAPYDYTVYMTCDGYGTIDDIGAFGVPDSAGQYSVDADCGITGYIWADDYVPFTGQLDSDSTGQMSLMGLGPLDIIEVMDVGALEGCWMGSFFQDSTGAFYQVTLDIDASGTVTSTTGFPSPMTGKFFHQSPYVAGHMVATAIVGPSPWNEINIRDAELTQNGLLISGTFGIDCTDCPAGTFYLGMCGAVGIDDRSPAPPSALYPIYPNPFNPRTTITYSLREAGRVDLRIYDAAGRLVRTLVGEQKPAGTYTEFWNGTDDRGAEMSSGVYFVRLETDGAVYSRKAVFLK